MGVILSNNVSGGNEYLRFFTGFEMRALCIGEEGLYFMVISGLYFRI
jgi:hypothetical protein